MKNFFSVKEEFINSRLDRWFRKNVCEVPQSLIEKNLRKGRIKVNNKKKKSSYKLQVNDKIIVHNIKFTANKKNEKKINYKPTKKDLSYSSSIFVEDNSDFAVINKPSGIAVQSGTKSKRNLLDILKGTKEFKDTKPYAVHRIDKDTTGIMIVAKNRKFAQLFTALFRIRKIYKTYIAIVLGILENKKGTFVDELVHFEGNDKIKTKAITDFSVIDSSKNYTLLKLYPKTGRKHQLRKQLLMRGHPILGDTKYRITKNYSDKKTDLMLHSYEIKFSISDKKYKFLANLPLSFQKNLKEKSLKIYQ